MSESNQPPNQSPLETQLIEKHQPNNKRTGLTLALVNVLMFGFAFAMVSLYRVVFSVTGWNNISTNTTAATDTDAKERSITVKFDATINGNVAWEFRPSVRSVVVTPGKKTTISYYVKNHSDKVVVTQSIPGITPWQATPYLKKIECFCFDTQTLQAGEAKDMTLLFVIDPELPADISTITLSYTIMDTHRTEPLSPDKTNLPTVESPHAKPIKKQ